MASLAGKDVRTTSGACSSLHQRVHPVRFPATVANAHVLERRGTITIFTNHVRVQVIFERLFANNNQDAMQKRSVLRT